MTGCIIDDFAAAYNNFAAADINPPAVSGGYIFANFPTAEVDCAVLRIQTL